MISKLYVSFIIWLFTITLGLTVFPQNAYAYDGIVVNNNEQIINISDKIEYKKLPAEFINNSGYSFIQEFANEGKSDLLYRQIKSEKAIVVYFNLMNRTDDELYLQLSNPSIDHITLIKYDESGEEVIYEGGNDLRNYIDNIRLSKYLIGLESGDSQQFYALVIEDDKVLGDLEIKLGTLKKYLDDRPEVNLLEGIFFGIFLLLVFYNLFQYFTIKDKSYVYFGLYAASLTLLFAIYKGYTIEYFMGEIPKFDIYVKLLICTSGILAILFTSNFLKTMLNTPRRHMWLLAFIIFYIISAVFLLFDGIELASKVLYYNTLFSILFITYIAFTMNKRGFKPSLNFFIAWMVLLTGIFLTTIRDFEILNYNLFTENILQASALIHIILLSFALATNVRVYIDKKNEAQEMALQTAIENEKLITHQKQLLETKVFERTKDLEQSISTLKKQEEELQVANEFKDKVFSVISHDLKSPVSTLTGLLELLKLNTLSAEEKSNIIENLDVALKNTKYLLDNILIWANPKLSKDRPFTNFHVYTIVDEIFQLFSIPAKTKNISLINNISTKINIRSDKDTVRLVLRNLVSNALKYTSSGGFVEIGYEKDGADLLLYVKDDGIGINKSDIKKLFENNQHHSTRGTQNEKGTGLGLILCKEFLEKMGGRIWVESEDGKGSTFFISLASVIEKKKSEKIAI